MSSYLVAGQGGDSDVAVVEVHLPTARPRPLPLGHHRRGVAADRGVPARWWPWRPAGGLPAPRHRRSGSTAATSLLDND